MASPLLKSIGPGYAAATGRSLLHAHKKQGRAALAAFAVVQAGTMFTMQAVFMVTWFL